MKRASLAICLSIFCSAASADAEQAEGQSPRFQNFAVEFGGDRGDQFMSLISDPISAAGTASEIIARAQACAARNVRNETFEISGSESSSFLGSLGSQTSDHRQQLQAGELIALSQPENGLLVVNSRTDFQHIMFASNVRARITIEARDERYRFVLSDLGVVQKNGGSAVNKGYLPVYKRWGLGWEPALTAAKSVTDKMAECIAAKPADNW